MFHLKGDEETDMNDGKSGRELPSAPSRRQFLAKVSGATAATIAVGTLSLEPVLRQDASVLAQDTGPNPDSQHSDIAYQKRILAAQRELALSVPAHPDNEDEERFPNRIGNFSKGLRHNATTGEVDPAAYTALLNAIRTGQFADFEALQAHQGYPDPARRRPFVNPLGGNAYDLIGTDSAQLIPLPPAPQVDSAERAAEMAELYWMALLRDVSFDSYASNATAQAAASDLSNLPGFRGPKNSAGQVTTQTLFRDPFPGCTVGPYISQFLIQQTEFGAQRIDQRIRPRVAGTDFMTTFASWLDVQNGFQPTLLEAPAANEPLRFIRNGRDISQYVHIDLLYQAYFVGMVILLNGITINESTNPSLFRFPFDENNPYGPLGTTAVQAGFGTFGGPHIATLVTEPATRALKAVWYQKWRVHRNLRPEAFGGLVEVERLGRANYPIHTDLTNRSTVLPQIRSRFSSHLLPQAFPEGSPLHPSYGSGHATVAGAAVTMLKAFFNEDTVFPSPRVINPADGGQTTIAYTGADRGQMTVGGELNKLASNIATGRNHAGVHWRSDAVEAIKLGERVAISMLADMYETFGEPFGGYRLTKFDGTRVTVRENPRT
jgi:hypothetical protein